MKTTQWFGGALALSLALSLTVAGGAWAQSKGQGYGTGSGGYGSGTGGTGDEKDKKQTGSKKSGEESASGVCTPQSCGPQTPKGASGSGSKQTSK